jgi:hypothetical protein
MDDKPEPGTPKDVCLKALEDANTKIYPNGWRDYSTDSYRNIRIAVLNRKDCPDHILEAMKKDDPDPAIRIMAESRLHARAGKPK